MTFQEVLKKYFRLSGNIASGQVAEPRYRGRWALAYGMAEMGFRVGVEIGTQYGYSAKMWCTANPNLHLTCIDPYCEYRKRRRARSMENEYEKARADLEPYNVTLIRKKSLEVVGSVRNASLDFVHIDGDHVFDQVVQDLVRWVPKVRKGGLVVIHDYFNCGWIDVTLAVNAYVTAHRIDPWYYTYDVSPSAFWERGTERLGRI